MACACVPVGNSTEMPPTNGATALPAPSKYTPAVRAGDTATMK